MVSFNEKRPVSDGQLLADFVERRSESALVELMRRHRRLVYLTSRSILGDDHAAEDASQLTFLTLARRAGELSRSESLMGWIYRTAELVSRGMLRSRARRVRRESEAAAMKPVPGNRWELWEQVAPELDAELDSMPRAQCEAVRMYYLEGLPQDRIATLAGCARSTVSARIAGGLSRLRSALARRGYSVPSASADPHLG